MNYLTALEKCAATDQEMLAGKVLNEYFAGVVLGDYGFFMSYAAMESEEIEAKVDDKEAKRAGDALIRLARQQQRAISGSQVDLAEVFRQTSATNAARAQGLVVPVEHEDFTFASGWDMTNKDHRRRLRHFLEHRRPQVVSMTWRIEDVPPGEPHEEVKFGLLASLALEVAKHQCSHGRSFFLRAPVPPGPWRELDWKQYLDVPGRQVRITQEHEYVVVTDLGDESSEAENEKICDETNEANVLMTDVPGSTVPDDGEKLAIKLMEESDYSPASCLRLLRETKWPRQRIKRASMKGSEAYQVLGQYSYGKFAGITLATYRLPHTLRYLNHFMTMRGALGPRSSLVVSRNASVNPHKDSNNIGQNYSIALGPFKGGELWEEDPGGQVMKEIKGAKVPGRLRKHHGKLNVFNPRKLHSVEPWTGERWSITAFQTRSAGKLSQEQEELLAKFGFQVRGYSQVIDLPSTRLSRQLVSYVESRCAGVPQDNFNFPVSTMDEIDPELDEENAEEPGHPEGNGSEEAEPRVSQHQKDLVRKLHVNTGHPPLERFLRTLKAAGALPHVLRYVRDEFRCETCNVKRGADPRRRAQCPRLFSFNRVLSIDVFFVSFRNRLEPILNVVCHGTNYQLAQRIESSSGAPTAHATWRALLTTWIRYLGPPSLIITDGGKEFQGRFERGLEQLGILQHVTAPESPWQNSRAERHGGWLKQKLTQELDSGQGIISSKEDLDELLASLVSAKNRWFNHGGYTPTQMVFGELPRVPGELLTSDETSLPVLNDAFHDPAGMDEAATEFKHRHQIRERARQLAMAETSREVLKRAARAAPHVNRSWATGQWVYVFRRGRVGDGLHPTSRWVPGIVVMPTPSIIWVLGRQIASDPQLGELLRKVVSGSHAGAVDVAKEGPPDNQEHLAPVERGASDAGLPLEREDEGRPVEPVPVLPEPPQAPRAPVEVPPGLERRLGPIPEELAIPVAQDHEASRRSSVQEPAQEPEANFDSRSIEANEGRDLPQPADSETSTRAAKIPRTETSAEPSSLQRAPGTPIQRLLQAVHRGRTEGASASHESSGSRSRSRAPERDHDLYAKDPALEGQASWFCHRADSGWTLVASRSDEIDIKKISKEEKIKFDASDKIEWEAILKTKAVRVAYGEEAQKIRERYPDRILASRMVRRRKPLPGINEWKAKSRWCVAGHSDPDTAHLTTFSPTPSSEGIMAFLHTGLGLNHRFSFADVRNAFCQSDPLKRPRGPLFAQPTDGLNLPPDAIIILDIPVYGLDDAPAAWRNTVVNYLVENNFVRNLVEPCWYMKFNEAGENEAQILIEVDDFIVSAKPEVQQQVKDLLSARFEFGKWEEDAAEYAGRRVQCLPDRVLIDQHKYITEQIFPIPLAKHRKAQKDAALTDEEFQAMRSSVYKINWIAKETRPELSGLASIMASKLKTATIDDILTINKNINHVRTTAGRPLILWKVDPADSAFIAVSDAGGVGVKHEIVDEDGLPTDHTQGAWLVLIAEELPLGKRQVRASPIAWRSSKLKRKVFSTFGRETQAMLQGMSEVDWIQIMVRDATAHDVKLRSWRNSLSPHMIIMRSDCDLRLRRPQCTVTDAKSLYDCLLKEHPQGKQDRRSSLELAIIVKDLQDTRSSVRWVPHQKMLADSMTKSDPLRANGALEQLLKTGVFSLVDVSEEFANRATDSKFRSRSHSASAARLLREYELNGNLVTAVLVEGALNHAQSDRDLEKIDRNDMDKNRDGTVTLEEMQASGASPACSQAFTSKTQLDKETGEVFQVLDVDDQGTLDQREPLDLNLALEQDVAGGERFVEGLLAVYLQDMPLAQLETLKLLQKQNNRLDEIYKAQGLLQVG
ncbi:unnamed protein product [Symbiodinium sp. KB8]|nr:unnamed protein product [Symbiodinium sp. KB8]